MQDDLNEFEDIDDLEIDDEETPPLETISVADIPVKVTIEVARFDVTLNELAKMEPGYKLPIEINPRMVNLTSGGKVIGKGELMEMGEIIGVKIIELYK